MGRRICPCQHCRQRDRSRALNPDLGVQHYLFGPCLYRHPIPLNHKSRLRGRAREILDTSPIENLILSSGDLALTDLDSLFSVLADRRPKDPIKALNLESPELMNKGLDLVSQYVHGNQALECLCLSCDPNHAVLIEPQSSMMAFVAAVYHSHLISISLDFNAVLVDQFRSAIRSYYPLSSYLRDINLLGVWYTIYDLSTPSAALLLLIHARLLMHSNHQRPLPVSESYIHQQSCHPTTHSKVASINEQGSVSTSWQSLPFELRLHIFQYLTPPLSSSQIVQVVDYATDLDTLPSKDQKEEMITVEDWLKKVACCKVQ